MQAPRAEAMALIAESIRRSVGVTVGDSHLAIGLALCDQISRVRARRAAKTIKVLNQYLPTRRDRSLAAAFPAIYVSRFAGLDVCVMVGNETYAREDADLYQVISAELGADDERATITVATPEVFARGGSHLAAIIARLSPEATRRVGRGLRGTAMLPDL